MGGGGGGGGRGKGLGVRVRVSTIKFNLVAKLMQSVYLCVIFHVKHQKLPFLAVLT